MVHYYRTPSGLYYKEFSDGRKVRVSRLEGQTGGAAKKASPKRSKSRASPKRSKSRSSPKRVSYTPMEQKCIDWAQAKIAENKKSPKGTFKHVGHLVAVSYEQARADHPECADFFDREKVRKGAERAARRAAKKKSRSRKRKSRGKKSRGTKRSKRRSKSRSKKRSKSRSPKN